MNFLDTCLAVLVHSERQFISSWRGFPLYLWVSRCPREAHTSYVRAHHRLCSCEAFGSAGFSTGRRGGKEARDGEKAVQSAELGGLGTFREFYS